MSWWLGHALPGTAWLLYGLLKWLQSLHTVPRLHALRRHGALVLLFPALMIAYALIGMIAEVGTTWDAFASGGGNWGHLLMLACLGVSGLVEWLSMLGLAVAAEPVWLVVAPVGISFMAFMLSVHDQATLFWTYLHTVSGVAMVPLVLAMILRNLAGLHAVRTRVVDAVHWRRWTLNRVYTHPDVYETPWPGLVAWTAVFNGLWWWQMGVEMGPHSTEHHPTGAAAHDGHELHQIVTLLMQHTLIAMAMVGALTALAKRFGGVPVAPAGEDAEALIDVKNED
jgi:hypothetical protein